jgi:hypothetical protein
MPIGELREQVQSQRDREDPEADEDQADDRGQDRAYLVSAAVASGMAAELLQPVLALAEHSGRPAIVKRELSQP